MKRITYYPQIFLGLTFNFGVIMSSLALLNKIDFDFVILYCAGIIWTLIYDTIYAYQDIEDDLKIGVKSSAMKFGENPKKFFIYLSLLMFLILIFLGWRNNFRSGFFFVILLNDLLMNYKIKNCDFKNPMNCLKAFKINVWIGLLILIAIILG
jgi:4-hydroxybenzoate polyprenyl transferase